MLDMFVVKRNGNVEEVHFDKITKRISKLINPEEKKFLDPIIVTQKVVASVFSGITTEELDNVSANICINMCTSHHLYSNLAGRILVSNLHKKTLNSFVEKQENIQDRLNLLDIKYIEYIRTVRDDLNNMIDYNRDYIFDYFGFKTLERAYLIKIDNKVVERPQDMFMRVAICINIGNLEMIKQTYDLMSLGYYTHASPTLFNAANKRKQLSSCFEGNTLVNTLRGPIPIKDVEIGDEVVTHLGNVKKVIQKHKNEINNRKIYKVFIASTDPFIVTEDHKLFTFNKLSLKNDWKQVKELSNYDYIMTPKYSGTLSNPFINEIKINEDIMKFIGIWYSNGDIINNGKVIRILFSYKNEELLDFCLNIRKYFEIDEIKIMNLSSQNNIEILYKSEILENIFNNFYNNNKKYLYEEFYKYSDELILSFLFGIVSYDNIDLNLKNQIYFLRRLHNLESNKFEDKIIDKQNFKYLRFESREEITIEDNYVYTLGVEDDHSYSIGGIIAQNCFLIGTEDSMDGITKTWADVSKISKWGGGIGLHVSNIRAKDSLIRGTNGPSSGIIPMLKVYNEIARYVDQCFLGNTKVYTDKGMVPIQNIKPYDKVFTNDGSLQTVKRVYTDKYIGPILFLQFFDEIECIGVTPSHPFWVIKNEYNDSYTSIQSKLNSQLLNPEWQEANTITINDLVGIPIPEYILDNSDYDESDCYFYGIFLCCGIINDTELAIDKFNMLNQNIKEFINNYLLQKGIKFDIINDQLIWEITSKLNFTKSQLIDFDYNLLHLPENKVKWIIQAFIEQIGISIDMQNHILIDTKYSDYIKYILLRLGKLAKKKSYTILAIPNNWNIQDNYEDYLIYNGMIYTKLFNIHAEITTIVYDLEIENNHNYLTQIGLVHNGGKRKGSIAIYLEPHHPDVMAFLDLRKNFGAETERARDLFLAMWISDLFMKQVEADADWYLMCPDKCPRLSDVYGDEYEELYWKYVKENKYNKKVKARDVMKAILDSQIETGTPYITFKDSANKKTNQKNIGTIKSSNLCVHEDTMVLTLDGYKNIKSIVDTQVKVWNGEEWSPTFIRKTGSNKDLIRINFSNQSYLDCTPEHKFYINVNSEIIIVDAISLQVNDKLIDFKLPNGEICNNLYVTDISESYKNVDTYCFNEPLKHMGVFNGVLTGQCNEILEYSDHEEYAVCNLASIAINKCVIPFKSNDKWIIYTKEDCKYCKWSKEYLKNTNCVFEEKLVSKDELKNIVNIENPTYPQIYYGEKYIGGYSELFNFTKGIYDFDKLYEIAYIATKNLNNIIDINYYPVPEAKKSNIRHRPIGLGIQGLADTLVLLKINFDSDECVEFNKKMMETIYLAAITASCDISKDRYEDMIKLYEYYNNNNTLPPEYYNEDLEYDNNITEAYHKIKLNRCEYNNKIDYINDKTIGAYSTFKGSPISQGQFQFDLWSLNRNNLYHKSKWEELEKKIKIYGVRNSLVTALMPTASTSQILGNNECFEFFTNNIYTRRTLAGDFPLVNKYLIDELTNIGLWNNDMKQLILANNGSISDFNNIPQQIRSLYQTIWEIKQIWVLKNAVARGPFVDQTQSMNIFQGIPDYQKLYSSHFWAWKNGLKTGIYYLRSKAAKDAKKFTIDPNIQTKLEEITSKEHEICENCSA